MSIYCYLAFALSLVVLSGCTKEDTQNIQKQSALLTEEKGLQNVPLTGKGAVCKVDGVPDGWVIIAQTSEASCPRDISNNAWLIKQPGASELVCKISPIPSGYGVVAQHSNTACPPPLAFNSVRIERRH